MSKKGKLAAAKATAKEAAENWKGKRPAYLSLMCLFWASATPLLIMMLLNPDPQRPWPEEWGPSFVPLSVTFEIAKFVGLIGIWWMRKFGVILYVLATLAQIILLVKIGAIGNSIVPVGFAIVNSLMGIAYFSRMR